MKGKEFTISKKRAARDSGKEENKETKSSDIHIKNFWYNLFVIHPTTLSEQRYIQYDETFMRTEKRCI